MALVLYYGELQVGGVYTQCEQIHAELTMLCELCTEPTAWLSTVLRKQMLITECEPGLPVRTLIK